MSFSAQQAIIPFDIEKIRADFPGLSRKINNNPLVYFDNGASAQKPQCVIDSVVRSYQSEYANVHRGLHTLANLATENFEKSREIVARFLNAATQNVIFTTGSTEALNLVSYAWGMHNLNAGDEIILSIAEHHANIVPFHFLRARLGVRLVWVDIDENGHLPPERVIKAITPRTRLITLTHMSNVTGVPVDLAPIVEAAHAKNIRVCVDGSQACVHMPVDVRALGVDFYAITGHKLYGPTGTGALYVREACYDEMQPFMGGGEMIDEVTMDHVSYATPPGRFEAGTPGIVEIIGLGAALSYLMALGMPEIARHERELSLYMAERLAALDFVRVLGDSSDKAAIFSFVMNNAGHPHDLATIMDQKGVAIRAGTHCAQPLMRRYGVTSSARASLGLYNTKDEIDYFIESLLFAHRLLG